MSNEKWRISERGVLELLFDGEWNSVGTTWSDYSITKRFREAVAEVSQSITAIQQRLEEAEAGRLRAEEALREAKDLLTIIRPAVQLSYDFLPNQADVDRVIAKIKAALLPTSTEESHD